MSFGRGRSPGPAGRSARNARKMGGAEGLGLEQQSTRYEEGRERGKRAHQGRKPAQMGSVPGSALFPEPGRRKLTPQVCDECRPEGKGEPRLERKQAEAAGRMAK